MAYDMDIFGNCDGLFICLASWANNVTEGYFWSIILIVMGIILFMATISYGVNRAFGYGGIGVAFASLLLVQASLIPVWVMTVSLVVGGLGIVSMFLGER